MQNSLTHRTSCRLCESHEVVCAVKLQPVPLAEKYTTTADEARAAARYPIDLYFCNTCGHVQLLDVIDSSSLWEGYTYHSGQTSGIVEHFKEICAKLLLSYPCEPGSLIIDIGSNDGSLLRPFKEAGLRVLGVDPAQDIAARATKAGIETLPTLLTSAVTQEIEFSHGRAAIVTAFNVFAHADNLGDMATNIHSLLADDGVFVFEVQYLLDIVEKLLLGTIFHEHMSHHSVKPIMQFLDRHGMELIDVERVSIQKGSIIGTSQRKGGRRKISDSVAMMVELETSRGLDRPSIMEEFNTRLARNKCVAKNLISEWNQKNMIIAGYGAARSGPTLLAQFGFETVVQYILDSHPQKVHLYSPGDGIPVVPVVELLTRRPDVVIILAWIHARTIIEKNDQYMQEGGAFLVCTPDIRIVDKDHPW